jgi:Trk K+ transport system NAD-binding subunit
VATAAVVTAAVAVAASNPRIIVAGGDRLRGRVAATLRAEGETVTEVPTLTRDDLPGLAPAAIRAFVLTNDDDVGNLAAALSAHEAFPDARIVLRMFNADLARQVETLVPHCTVISASRVAAPAFIEAAGIVPRGRHHVPRRVGSGWSIVRGLWRDPRLRLLGLAVGGLIAVSIAIFMAFHHLSFVDATYFSVTVITTTGFGDINLQSAEWPLKLYGALLMLLGAASLATVFALITDALISSRIVRVIGAVPRGMRSHTIIAGLGTLGFRIAQHLAEIGEPVVAVELSEDGRFVNAARALGIPVVIGDAALPQTLALVNAQHARCIFAVTDRDEANIEMALNARNGAPAARIVLRIFDAVLADSVEHTLGLVSRSVPGLAAPAFAAAALAPTASDRATQRA